MTKQEMEKSKINKGEGRLQCFATLTVRWFDGADSKHCLHVKVGGPKSLCLSWKLSKHCSDVLHIKMYFCTM